ncbi:unnamed protein product [Moneuplotes crassus]|uniref:Uncharacterized protein n=1 Tax=Euplotes crassus TaxID=5936 RepID=A0AAD1UGV8_EUPCR|nr:unnamed protein product [Moneuplotes crassus]
MEEESFNKRGWIQKFRNLHREYNQEDISKFKSLILFKKDFTSFIDDSNKEDDKKNNKFISLRKNKIKEVNNIKKIVLKAKAMKERMYDDESVIDKLQTSVRDINENLKEFKIKNKNEYGILSQAEEELTRELELFENKMTAIIEEDKATDRSCYERNSVISNQSSMTGGTKRRPASVTTSKRTNISRSS